MDNYTSKLIERTKHRREQMEGVSCNRPRDENFPTSSVPRKSPQAANSETVVMRSRTATKDKPITGISHDSEYSASTGVSVATAYLVELRPAGGTQFSKSNGTGQLSSSSNHKDLNRRDTNEANDYPKTMAQRLEIWQKRISHDESNPSENIAARPVNAVSVSSSIPSTNTYSLPPKSPTQVSKRIAGAQQRLYEQTAVAGVPSVSPKIGMPTPFVATVQQSGAEVRQSKNNDRLVSGGTPLYGRPTSRAVSTYYSAGGASKTLTTNDKQPSVRYGAETKTAADFTNEFNAKLKRFNEESSAPQPFRNDAQIAHEPAAKGCTLTQKSLSNSSLVVSYNPEVDTPRGFNARSRSPSISLSRNGSSTQLGPKPYVSNSEVNMASSAGADTTDNESVLSDSSDRLRIAAVRTFMNRRAQEVRASDLPKEPDLDGKSNRSRDNSLSRSSNRIRFGQDAVRFLTDTETENDTDRLEADSSDEQVDSQCNAKYDYGATAKVSRSESIERRRTRHGSEPAGVTMSTHAPTPAAPVVAEPVKSYTPNKTTAHSLSVTKLGGTLQLPAGCGPGSSGSSLYSEITRELAKQNDLMNAMLAETTSGSAPIEAATATASVPAETSRMDSSDWSVVTSISELESEDDLKPSMNSTKLTSKSSSIRNHVYANVPGPLTSQTQSQTQSRSPRYHDQEVKTQRRDRESSKRVAQPEVQEPVAQSQSDVEVAVQRSRSIRARIEKLLAAADQQDEIIKQASAALARCKQIQQRMAINSTDPYPCALPIQEFVEANRVLLIACQRRQAFLSEVEQYKTKTLHDVGFDSTSERYGSLTIDNLRFGLKREFLERCGSFATEVHYALVTLRIGSNVIVSQMINTEHDVDLRARCIEVPNKFQFEISPEFTLRLQVFCLTTSKELGVVPRSASSRTSTLNAIMPSACMSSSAKKSKHANDDSVASGGSVAAQRDTALPHYVTPSKPGRSSKKESKKKKNLNETPSWSMAASSFSEVGSFEMTMRSVNSQAFRFERVPPLLCPLDGSVNMRLTMQMESGLEFRGFLTMFEDVAGVGSWHRRWFLLKNDMIRFWKYPDDEFRKEPLGVIRLDQCANDLVRPVSREKCARPNTLELLIQVRQIQPLTPPAPNARNKPQMLIYSYLLSADTKEDRAIWCEKLNTNITFLRTWFPDRMPKPFKPSTTPV